MTIKDNGEGFSDISDDVSHTALKNIRQRLQAQCGGTLKIESSPEGTTVTVFVPDKK